MLFVPGDRPERMDRALGTDADAVIFDLGDSVTADRHIIAREAICERIVPDGVDVWVRTQTFGTIEAELDLQAVIRPGLAGVVLPDVREAQTVRAADAHLTDLESAAGVPPGGIQLLPLIESAIGLHHAFDILSASARVTIGAFAGAPGGDLCNDLGIEPTSSGLELLHARSHLVLEARAAGKMSVLDSVWVDLEDLAGLEADSRLGRRLGYTGRFAIHPAQLPALHEAYQPSAVQISDARALLAAYEAAGAAGHGAVRHRGRLIDRAMALGAERLLASCRLEARDR